MGSTPVPRRGTRVRRPPTRMKDCTARRQLSLEEEAGCGDVDGGPSDCDVYGGASDVDGDHDVER